MSQTPFKQLIDEVTNKASDKVGYGKASPVIRSMYPSKSRGEMAREFSQCAAEGAQLPNELLLLALEALEKYQEQVAILYKSNWKDQSAMQLLVYDCAEALTQIRSRLENVVKK